MVVLRLRRLAYGCALGTAGATIAVALVARLDFAYRAPSLHVALETTAASAASTAPLLLLGRFRRTGFLDELLLSAGLALLALSNLVFAALPAALELQTSRVTVWALLFTGALAALLICIGALLPRRRIRVSAEWPLAVYGGAAIVAIIGLILLAGLQAYLPGSVSPSGAGSRPHSASPAMLTVQLYLAFLYLLAAYGFARRHRITGDELSVWLMLACIFSAAARVNYAFHPSLFSSWVYTGDVFRLGFYLALLVDAAREIASYWRSAIDAASLEERRRIAREVQDGLAQEIAFIGRNVQALRVDEIYPELVDRIMVGV